MVLNLTSTFDEPLETRDAHASIENPNTNPYSAEVMAALMGSTVSYSGVSVNIESAMTVPAFNAGVTFIADQIASLPWPVFQKSEEYGRVEIENAVSKLLKGVVNTDGETAYEFKFKVVMSLYTTGRAIIWAEKDMATDEAKALWLLVTKDIKVTRSKETKKKVYKSKSTGQDYPVEEVIDIKLYPKPDGLSALDPIAMNRQPLGLSIALDKYSQSVFQNGGVPPLQLVYTGEAPISNEAYAQVVKEMAVNIRAARATGSNILPLAKGFKLEKIGLDPTELQMLEAQKDCVVRIARFLKLPPSFLQDMTNSTYSNSEQNAIVLVKHTLSPLAVKIQSAFNAILFGDSDLYCELNLDGLLRGDIAARVAAENVWLDKGVLTRNEVRELEGWAKHPDPAADQLISQGANAPLKDLGAGTDETAPKTK